SGAILLIPFLAVTPLKSILPGLREGARLFMYWKFPYLLILMLPLHWLQELYLKYYPGRKPPEMKLDVSPLFLIVLVFFPLAEEVVFRLGIFKTLAQILVRIPGLDHV